MQTLSYQDALEIFKKFYPDFRSIGDMTSTIDNGDGSHSVAWDFYYRDAEQNIETVYKASDYWDSENGGYPTDRDDHDEVWRWDGLVSHKLNAINMEDIINLIIKHNIHHNV